MTIHYIQVWKKCIVYLMPEMPGDAEVQALAEFLAGGTGQMIKSFKASSREDVGKFCRHFTEYCGRVLCVDDEKTGEFEELMTKIVTGLQ